MANYLFLRGSRNKHFFSDVASKLEEKGHKCYQLKFELGELLIQSKIESVFVPFQVTKEEYPISDEHLLNMNIYNVTYKKEMLNKNTPVTELRMYKRYMTFIDRFIEKHDINVICMFNGYHWIDRVATYIANERGLGTLFFEQGYFRPYTLTCDPQGINDASSMPRDVQFYRSLHWNSERLSKHLMTPEHPELLHIKGERLTQVALIKGVSMIGGLFKVNPQLYAHINWYEAVKYFLFKQAFKFKKPDLVPLPEEYLFVPFQVSRDTQIFYSSPIKSMEELVDMLYRHVEEINRKQNRNIHIIFKEHPEDMPRNRYAALKDRYASVENVQFVQKRNVGELIQHSLAVVTINSTVGIEALAQYKRVITLGEAFYNIPEVVTHCQNLDRLDEVIEGALAQPVNKTIISQFLYYLRFHYQLEGNLTSPNEKTAEIVADHLHERETKRDGKRVVKE